MDTSSTGPTVPRGWPRVAALLVAGVVFAGVADYLLSSLGYPGAGALVWAVGYGGTVFAVWLLAFRGREFELGGDPVSGSGSEDASAPYDGPHGDHGEANAGARAGATAGAGAVPEGYAPSSSSSASTGDPDD